MKKTLSDVDGWSIRKVVRRDAFLSFLRVIFSCYISVF